MNLFDNTRISDFRKCERLFYFRHERDWVQSTKSAALAFGSGWHSGMDVVWKILSEDPGIETLSLAAEAVKAFDKTFSEEGWPTTNEFLELSMEEQKRISPRTPLIAMEMFYNYIEHRRGFITNECELLAIEEPFAVQIDPARDDLLYVGRLDKVVRLVRSGKVVCIEHKTTTSYKKDGGPFRADFMDSFSPNSQVDGYTHAGKMKYGPSFKGIYIDAALVHAQVHDGFRLIPIERSREQLEGWLWQTHVRINQIGENKQALGEARLLNMRPPYLPAFPQKTEACTLYGNCPYMDLCKSEANPEMWDETPDGYKTSHWSPFNEIDLERIGLKKDRD